MRQNLEGRRFGHLTVMEYDHTSRCKSGTSIFWKCRCDCGNTTIVKTYTLTSGHTKSCGCGRKVLKHGMTGSRFLHGQSPEYGLWARAKLRAKHKGLKFDLEPKDIQIPDVCPLLGIKLKVGKGKLADHSPSLDRKKLNQGYVRGNVWVISNKANSIKRNASLQELKMLVTNLEALLES